MEILINCRMLAQSNWAIWLRPSQNSAKSRGAARILPQRNLPLGKRQALPIICTQNCSIQVRPVARSTDVTNLELWIGLRHAAIPFMHHSEHQNGKNVNRVFDIRKSWLGGFTHSRMSLFVFTAIFVLKPITRIGQDNRLAYNLDCSIIRPIPRLKCPFPRQ